MAAGKPTHKWKGVGNQMVRFLLVYRAHRNKILTATPTFSELTFPMAFPFMPLVSPSHRK